MPEVIVVLFLEMARAYFCKIDQFGSNLGSTR